MAQSTNALGTIGEDGVLRDGSGKEVPIGLDEVAKQELLERLQGPMVRHMPSEMDRFLANGGVLRSEPYKREDSIQSGHLEDLGGNPDAPAGSVAATNTKETKKSK